MGQCSSNSNNDFQVRGKNKTKDIPPPPGFRPSNYAKDQKLAPPPPPPPQSIMVNNTKMMPPPPPPPMGKLPPPPPPPPGQAKGVKLPPPPPPPQSNLKLPPPPPPPSKNQIVPPPPPQSKILPPPSQAKNGPPAQQQTKTVPPAVSAPQQTQESTVMNTQLSEDDKKKQELEQNADFMKYVRLNKVIKVSAAQIKQKMKAEGKFQPKDLDLFLDSKQEITATACYN